MIGAGGNGRCVGGVVQHAADAHVEAVGVQHHQVDVASHGLCELLADIVDVVDVGPDGGELVEQTLAEASAIGKGRRNHRAAVLRPVLVIVRQGNLRAGDVGALEDAVGQADELGEADAGGHAHLRRGSVIPGLELEVALEAEVQQLAAVEQVLVIVIQLRGQADEPRRVHGRLQVGLESLQA